MPSSGRWTWNNSSNTLEFLSSSQGGEKQDRRHRDKRAQKNSLYYHDHGRKGNERGTTPKVGGRAYGQGRQSWVPGQRSPTRQNTRHGSDHTHVTLEDVKSQAYEMLSEVEEIPQNFEGIRSSDQFDEFLRYLLNDFHWFFEKRTHEQKPNPMNIEPSLAELKYYEDLCNKLEAAGKQLGRAYCVLVLGIGLEGQHHMSCGTSRVSSTYKDRSMFETFYSFCTFLVWIAFRRPEFDVVKKELGRMLRSDTFNPSLRVKNAPSQVDGDDGADENDKEETKMTPAEYRRNQGRRPPIKSIINQRSPALVSILPSPKEESHWLFQKPESAGSAGKGTRDSLKEEELDEEFQHLTMDVAGLKMGIIGEPWSLFNRMTLAPLDAENEEEGDEEEGAETGRRESRVSDSPQGQSAQGGNSSRQRTAMSAITNEAVSDGEDI